ncbi:hypothetical protein [Pseudomonas sp. PDM07]|uniref:hypothetical protein n=1 Tax=Pseudomonas sp. PDM07 TaxID=2769264 RepID=UPI00177ADC9C|nr:hypothetical protein [Pseudomonas sp. PDM07]MBD9616739.1 hypothetical protein [Pseudomonas sp. PDM07]
MKYVYIDSNIFDFIYENGIDLSKEFPSEQFELRIVGEQVLEKRAIPEGKQWLKKFIEDSIESWGIKVDRLFGFYDTRHSSEDQRVGGYGDGFGGGGRYTSLEESEFIKEQRKEGELEKRKSGLYPDETDISLGARAMAGSTVITLDAKKGPLRTARDMGAPVVFLTDFIASGKSLRDFVFQ